MISRQAISIEYTQSHLQRSRHQRQCLYALLPVTVADLLVHDDLTSLDLHQSQTRHSLAARPYTDGISIRSMLARIASPASATSHPRPSLPTPSCNREHESGYAGNSECLNFCPRTRAMGPWRERRGGRTMPSSCWNTSWRY